MNAFVIDAFHFSRHQQHREGEIAVSDLARLSKDLADQSGVVHWSLLGGIDLAGHPHLKLSVSSTVQLTCQRCLNPFAFDVASESILILARDEADADEIDASLADDTVDVIVGSKTLSVIELIEDEALLTIPVCPKHAVCPDVLKF